MAPPYAHVRGVLDALELDALRRECECLMTQQCAPSSYDALDVFELARALPDDASSARTDNVAFVRARRAARRILFADAGDDAGDADATVIASAQLRTIPQSLPTDGDTHTSKNVFLFNAHYVVKPPDSTDVFTWHCDGDEQLGLCVGERSTYVSAWCPLDDVDERNGCLLFRNRYGVDSTDDGDGGSVSVHAKAGDVVFFASDIEHASGPNTTKRSRRVFYAQYSFERIVASVSDADPLAFAVPTEATA